MQELIGEKVQGDRFLDICNVARNIKDYDVEDNQEYNDAIIMEDQEEEQNDEGEQQYVEEEVMEEEEKVEGNQIKLSEIKKQ